MWSQPSVAIICTITLVSVLTTVVLSVPETSNNNIAELTEGLDHEARSIEKRSPWKNKVAKHSDENVAIAVNGNAVLSNLDNPALIKVLGGRSKHHGGTWREFWKKSEKSRHHRRGRHGHFMRLSHSGNREGKGHKYHLHLNVNNKKTFHNPSSSGTKKPKSPPSIVFKKSKKRRKESESESEEIKKAEKQKKKKSSKKKTSKEDCE